MPREMIAAQLFDFYTFCPLLAYEPCRYVNLRKVIGFKYLVLYNQLKKLIIIVKRVQSGTS